ncbi:MAG: thioredoxin domain-containing protein [Patescibacteria group bacterium]|nr:thioredoxin domain-containing protein [Patescibacteria group bacterium]
MKKIKKWQIFLGVFLLLFLIFGIWFVRKIFLYRGAIEDGSIIINNIDIAQYSEYLGSFNVQKEDVSREELESNASPSRGSIKPIMTIVEFADFNCSYCLSAYDDLKLFVNENKDDVKLIYRHFPISDDLTPALASTCANEQGKFWAMHDKLFENQRILDESAFMRFAKELGLDMNKFETCYSSKKYESIIYSDVSLGLGAGISGTPVFFVNGYLFQGVITKQIWEQLLDGVKNEIKE